MAHPTTERPPEGARRDPARAALAALAAWYVRAAGPLVAEALRDRGPEGVHRLRAHLRRLRCVLRLLARCTRAPALGRAVAWAKALGEEAGAVRDVDVARMVLDALDVPPSARTTARAALATRRKAAVAGLRAGRAGRSPTERTVLARDLAALGARPGRKTLRGIGRRQLAREFDALRDLLAAELTRPGAYHAVRRRARRLRDTVEVLGRAAPKRARQARHRLQPLHAALGALQDGEVLQDLLADVGEGVRQVRRTLARRRSSLLAALEPSLALLAADLAAEE